MKIWSELHGNMQRISGSGLSATYCEEAFQVQNEDDFNKIDMSIRGKLPEPLFHSFTLTLNPSQAA